MELRKNAVRHQHAVHAFLPNPSK